MAGQNALQMLQALQQMGASNQRLAIQKEQQRRMMEESMRKQQIRGTLGDAVTNAASNMAGGPGAFDPTNQADRAMIFQEGGQEEMMANLIPQFAAQGPEGLEVAQSLMKDQRSATGGNVFGQQLRGMGTDLLFLSQEYGGGKVPTNQEELQEITVKAAQDPSFGEKRQEWANNRTAGKFQDVGVAADDPRDLIIFDPKRGMQYRTRSGGDALKQLLTTATADETSSLAVYKDLHSVTNELREAFDANLVGLYDGNINALKSRFVGTPEYTKFKSTADRLRTIVYGFSGKQINETELAWLEGILPKLYNPDENFMTRLDSIGDWVADKQDAQLQAMRANRRFSGLESLKDESPGVSPKRLKAFQKKVDAQIEKTTAAPEPTEAEYEALYSQAYQQGIPEDQIEDWVDSQLNGGN